jgi:hypothetical protein
MKFEILTTVNMSKLVYWVVRPYGLERYNASEVSTAFISMAAAHGASSEKMGIEMRDRRENKHPKLCLHGVYVDYNNYCNVLLLSPQLLSIKAIPRHAYLSPRVAIHGCAVCCTATYLTGVIRR